MDVLTKPPISKLRRVLGKTTRWVGVFIAFALTGVTVDGWKAFGKRASGERRARMERSPQWKDGRFVNPQPLSNDMVGALIGGASTGQPVTAPRQPLPTSTVDPAQLRDRRRPSGLRVTWLGHSPLLVEIDGHRVLTDPVWSERASPFDLDRPAPLVPAAARARTSCRRSTRWSSRTTTTTTSTTPTIVRDEGLGTPPSSCRSASARTSSTGACPRRASSSSTGGSGRGSARSRSSATPARHASGRNAVFGQRRDALGRLRAHRRAAPRLLLGRHRALPRRSPTSARASARST